MKGKPERKLIISLTELQKLLPNCVIIQAELKVNNDRHGGIDKEPQLLGRLTYKDPKSVPAWGTSKVQKSQGCSEAHLILGLELLHSRMFETQQGSLQPK